MGIENAVDQAERWTTVKEDTFHGRIIDVARGGEAIVIEIVNGDMKMTVIANIPPEGSKVAPAYVKTKVRTSVFEKAQKSDLKKTTRRTREKDHAAEQEEEQSEAA